MMIFGTNLTTMCKELVLPIAKIKRFRLTEMIPVTLYNMDTPNDLVNIPNEVFFRYNAWMKIPGEWMGHYEGSVEIKINKVKILVPKAVWEKKAVANSPDIFSYILKQYHKNSRIYDILYTISRMNDLSLTDFLDKHASTWS